MVERIYREDEDVVEMLDPFNSGHTRTIICALASLKSGTCMLPQEALDELLNCERIRMKILGDDVLFGSASSILLSTTDHWTKATRSYVKGMLSQTILSKGATIGIHLGGVMRSIQVLSAGPGNAGRVSLQTKSERWPTRGSKKLQTSPNRQKAQVQFADLDEKLKQFQELMNQAFSSDRDSSTFKPSGARFCLALQALERRSWPRRPSSLSLIVGYFLSATRNPRAR